MRAADELRREVNGDTVSYVVTRNVNYTNVCYFRCGFCAFSKGRLADDLRGKPYLVPLDEIVRRADEAWARGATEICLQGGIHPAFTGDYYLEVCRTLKEALPELHVHAFSALEVWQGAATLGLPLDEYLARLREAGLASLPGTAAEILDDEVRAVICPDKVSTAQWLEVHDAAHRVGLRSTTTIMFGHVDSPRSWARHLLRAPRAAAPERRLHRVRAASVRAHGGADLPQGPRPPRADLPRGDPRPRGRPARASTRGSQNIQASWVKLGLDGGQVALQAGANDLGGTLMNESISRAAGAEHGQEASPERARSRDPGARPRAAPANDLLRGRAGGAPPRLVRRRAPGGAAQPAGQRGRSRRPAAPRPPSAARVRTPVAVG